MVNLRAACVVLVLVAGCEPELVDDTSVVAAPRLLAVQASPAEAKAGTTVTLRALYADAAGPVDAPSLAWAFCMNRKPFTEAGPVDPACLTGDGAELIPIGDGVETSGPVPAETCRLFGPDRPAPLPGEPAGRPVDPDDTGGYFQPVRVHATEADESALAQVRITCGLPAATPEQAAEYRRRQRPNENPVLEALTLDGTAVAASAAVAPGAEVALAVTWPACAPERCVDGVCEPCGGSESYVWFDPRARDLVTRREAMRVSWFATAGAFDRGHSGRTEDEAGLRDAGNRWRAPATAGPVFLWVVLRDDCGGTGWATVRIDVGGA